MKTEQALIGAILHSPKKLLDVIPIVSHEDFTDPQAAKSFSIASSLWKNKKTVDLATISAVDENLVMYLAEASGSGSPAGSIDYARSISGAAKNRRIISKLNDISSSSDHPTAKLDSILSLYQSEISTGRRSSSIGAVLGRFEKKVSEARRNGGVGFSTGFSFLDDIYVKYIPGHIWTIGAFTSVGKTAVMTQKICNLIMSEENPSIVVVSTEMTEEQMVSRIIANFTGIHSQRILTGHYRHGEEEVVEEYKSILKTKNLYLYDDVYKLGDIEMVLRRADLQGGVDISFVDYVQNCTVPEAANEYQTGSILAKRLQKLAKDVSCTLICLSQVSNDVGRGNTDQLELKGAGEWAAVSDVGIMLTRHKTNRHLLKYDIKKNRHGRLTDAVLEYKMDFTKLEIISTQNT